MNLDTLILAKEVNKDVCKIVIADDHPIFRVGLNTLITKNASYRIIGEADNGADALRLLEELVPEIGILDKDMPFADGLEIAEKIKQKKLNIKIVLLTNHLDMEAYQRALDIGIEGIMLKEIALAELHSCLESVRQGNRYICKACENILNSDLDINDQESSQAYESLTSTEKSILKLIAEHKTSNEIADVLFKSPKTVENHRYNICRKLNLKGNNSLLAFALKNKLRLKL